MLFRFATKHSCDRQTDGRTDGQNSDPLDRASVAALRGKMAVKCVELFT